MAGTTKKKRTATNSKKKTVTKTTTTKKKTAPLKLKENAVKKNSKIQDTVVKEEIDTKVEKVKETKKAPTKAKKKAAPKVKTTKKTTTGKVEKKETNKTPKETKKKTTTKKQPVVKPKVEEKPKEVVKNKKEDKTNVETSNILKELKYVKNNLSNKLKDTIKKYKKLPKNTKAIIIAGIVCLLIIILEAIIFINHNNRASSKAVYHDSYNAIAVSENSLVVAGNSDFKYSKENKYSENSRGKLVKYDEMGNLIFEKKYDKGLSTTFNDVIEVSDGYIVVGTGVFSEEEKKNEGREALIVKFTKEGEVVWEQFYQVLTNTGFNRVIEVNDGYIAVGQSIYANMELGNHQTGGGIIVKYDKEGKEVWHNNHGGTKSGSFNDLVEVDGNIYVVGKDGADSGNLVKYNGSGEYQWHKNYSYTDNYGLTGLTKNGDYLYAVGSKKVFDTEVTDDDDRYTTNTDALLIKYNLDGEVQYEKTFGGSSYERYNKIMVYHNNFYAVGHICSHDAGLKVTTDKDEEMTGLIVRYDLNGNILKKATFGGSNNDNLTDVATDSTSYYIVGYSNSLDGNMVPVKANGKDYFGKLLKLNSKFMKMFDR